MMLAFTICEVCVRVIYPEYGIPVFTTKLLTEYDPLLGWRNIPNFRGAHVQDEYTIVEQFNSKGIRGPEYPYKKPKGEFRILILGDSFAEGYTVEFQDLFSEVMEEKLNKALKTQIEVINAGTGGYGTDQELLFFRTEGKKYEPDLVIVLYYFNDTIMNVKPFYNIWRRGWKPLFELVDGKLHLKFKPEKTWDREEEVQKDLAKNEHEFKQKFVLWKPKTWFLYRLCRHAWTRRTKNTINELPIEMDVAVSTGKIKPEHIDPNFPYTGRWHSEWIMTEALMAEIRKEAFKVGANFLIYYVPIKKEIYTDKRQPSEHEHNLHVLSSRCDIPIIPTIELFRRHAAILNKSNKRLYWKKDPHWTLEGHRLTGIILAEYIIAKQKKFGLE